MLFYDSDPNTGQLNGNNRIDIAVSDTGDPSGSWRVYSFDVTRDGPSDFNLGDYPQIGADAQGLYITTNSYPFFEDGFGGAQLYALSKRGVATGTDTRVTRVPLGKSRGATAFGLRPTTAPAAHYATEHNGTEYLLSSQATPEAGNKQGFSQAITLWGLTNIDTLAPNRTRALTLKSDAATVDRYGVPPLSAQKAGNYPLGQCLSVQPCRTQLFTTSPAFPHHEGAVGLLRQPDEPDRLQQRARLRHPGHGRQRRWAGPRRVGLLRRPPRDLGRRGAEGQRRQAGPSRGSPGTT